MRKTMAEIERHAQQFLVKHELSSIASRAAQDCAWLEAVGYPGLKLLAEAVFDTTRTLALEKDLIGLDLATVSCVFLADDIEKMHAEHGRIFLLNVRHGLILGADECARRLWHWMPC